MVLRGRNLSHNADLNKRLEDGAKTGLDALFEKNWKKLKEITSGSFSDFSFAKKTATNILWSSLKSDIVRMHMGLVYILAAKTVAL